MIFRTIRIKLLFSFLVFLLISFFIISVNIWYNNREDKAFEILIRVSKISLENQNAGKLARDYLIDETINSEYHQRKSSAYLDLRQKHVRQVTTNLAYLKEIEELNEDQILNFIDSLIRKFEEHEEVFAKTVSLIEYRGFKDHGLEGEMRDYIHAIENVAPLYKIDMAKLLMIRRHEKDFILRKEDKYIEKIRAAISTLRQDIISKVKGPPDQASLIELLEDYGQSFMELARVEKIIGFNKNQGLRKELTRLNSEIERTLAEINIAISARIQKLHHQNRIWLSIAIFISISLIIFLAFYITKILSRPIRQLSGSINEVIQHNFSKEVIYQPLMNRDEIGALSRDFAYMLEKMHDSFDEVQSKSIRIEQKQKLLMESLNYGKKIQQAILPDPEDFEALFPDHFIIYYPMHVVSGDFYWLVKREDDTFLGVIDCTGHGVPGAFMSMIGHSLLNRILIEKRITDPGTILEELDQEIKAALNQDKNRNSDGMEASICRITYSRNITRQVYVTFAGAKGNLFYSHRGEIGLCKGVRRFIGGIKISPKEQEERFISEEILLQEGDVLYLGSDGYWDQPNAKRRKLGQKKFFEVLENIQELSAGEQGEVLRDELFNHMGSLSHQRDDITLVGVRL